MADGLAKPLQFAAATIAGGTASAIGGGKFANGALTAAFGYLFNQMAGGRQKWEFSQPEETPEMARVRATVQQTADTAAAKVDEACDSWKCRLPWIRGTLIHTEFSNRIREISGYSPDVSYKDGFVVNYGTLGSVRTDAVYGDLTAPKYVIELKTGRAIPGNRQLNN